MSIKIIDNKKIELTDDEWTMFNSICRSYDRPNFKGENLAKNLFETDDSGIIVFLKPPTSNYTSMEMFLFFHCIYQHQHMKILYKQVEDLASEIRSKIQELQH